MKSGAVEMMRQAKLVVEAWTQPEQFDSPEEFLSVVTDALDDLALAAGQDPVSIEGLLQ